ncbi:hypothetical protein M3Y94_00664100 [Aphelenchoides besseyi]|nr:hypothetical protein M3Y94_00664100 [Aphelenchoides besseyi]KAI6231268.1 hypothetical protein M3Y95_00363500 [Aphelenchoides besseyi]
MAVNRRFIVLVFFLFVLWTYFRDDDDYEMDTKIVQTNTLIDYAIQITDPVDLKQEADDEKNAVHVTEPRVVDIESIDAKNEKVEESIDVLEPTVTQQGTTMGFEPTTQELQTLTVNVIEKDEQFIDENPKIKNEKKTGLEDQLHFAYLQRLRNESTQRLQNFTEIKRQNQHSLPTVSAFGTKNSKEVCRGDDVKRCGTKFKMLETTLRFSSQYKLMACLIQKSMSTLLQSTMCFLRNEQAFLQANRSINSESYSKRFCMWQNERNLQWRGLEVLNGTGVRLTDEWTFLAIVRDPIERFISAFVDKCIRRPRFPFDYCNGCNANLTCFVIREYERIQNISTQPKVSRTFEDRHFFPQNWRCDFRLAFKRYHFLKYTSQDMERFLRDLELLLKSKGVPTKSVNYILTQLRSGRSWNSTVHSDTRQFLEKRLRSSAFLMEHVVRMYWYDFLLFGFGLPEYQFT